MSIFLYGPGGGEKYRSTVSNFLITYWITSIIHSNPKCFLFWSPIPENIEVKTLNCKDGLEYLHEVWPEPEAFKYRTKMAQRLPSSGTFLDGKGVSGAIVTPTGYMGIGTETDYRGKGYASICFQHLTKYLGESTQLHPCAQVYLKNKLSPGLILRAGLKVTHLCDFILYSGHELW